MFPFSTRGQDLRPVPPGYAAAVGTSGHARPWRGRAAGKTQLLFQAPWAFFKAVPHP